MTTAATHPTGHSQHRESQHGDMQPGDTQHRGTQHGEVHGVLAQTGAVWQRARREPTYGAFVLMRIGFVVLPLWMGADKFANTLTDWPGYLAPWIVALLPFSAQTAMYVVGAIEIVAGIAVAIKPRYAAYVVTLWLAGIIVNLLTYSGYYDVALRDFGLLVAALGLARLSAEYDPSWTGRKGTKTNAS